jgi:hypothetical protein
MGKGKHWLEEGLVVVFLLWSCLRESGYQGLLKVSISHSVQFEESLKIRHFCLLCPF